MTNVQVGSTNPFTTSFNEEFYLALGGELEQLGYTAEPPPAPVDQIQIGVVRDAWELTIRLVSDDLAPAAAGALVTSVVRWVRGWWKDREGTPPEEVRLYGPKGDLLKVVRVEQQPDDA